MAALDHDQDAGQSRRAPIGSAGSEAMALAVNVFAIADGHNQNGPRLVLVVVRLQPRFDELLDTALLLAVEFPECLVRRRQKLNPPGHAGA